MLGGFAGIAARRDELAHGRDIPPAERAVEPEPHHPAGPQQGQQHAPARERIGEVMQPAARIDHVERAPEVAERMMSACA